MNDLRFDRFVRSLAEGQSRRALLKGLAGFSGAVIGSASLRDRADAARRGYGGPPIPPCVPQCNGVACGSDGCGGTCTCARGHLCIAQYGLCFLPCQPDDLTCGDGCVCDEGTEVCVSDQYGAGCNTSADCPSGWFCYHNGAGTYCATACPHDL